MSAERLTQAEYLKHLGNRCPFCASDDIHAGSFEADGLAGWVPVVCFNEDCAAEWTDNYTLTEYDPVVIPPF